MDDLIQQLSMDGLNLWQGNKGQGVAPYLLTEEILMAIKVALVTARPLLLSGLPGCGKTQLAKAFANQFKWSFLRHTLTSRSRLEHLTAEVDQLQRLHDAQAAAVSDKPLMPDWAYLKPGLFWWGFNHKQAATRGRKTEEIKDLGGQYAAPVEPAGLRKTAKGTVILLDEIDKAEPDLPNDLLEPLDTKSFSLADGTQVVAPGKHPVLVFITTNGERELPAAFLRRCVHLQLKLPNAQRLVDIAQQHFSDYPDNADLYWAIAEKVLQLRDEANERGERAPGTSEFLDAAQACLDLNVSPSSNQWSLLEQATLSKS